MEKHGKMMTVSWGKFAAMIATSVLAMFFLMYQLVYSFDHATFSLNRLVSSLVMGSVMTLIMLGFMWRMLGGVATKIAVLVGAIVVGVAILAVNRNQILIGDEQFMKSMIPHHSIAINNARKSDIRDPRVKRLADEIIESQVREIAEMKWLLEDIEMNGRLGDEPLPRVPAVLTPEMRAKIEQNIQSATPPSAQKPSAPSGAMPGGVPEQPASAQPAGAQPAPAGAARQTDSSPPPAAERSSEPATTAAQAPRSTPPTEAADPHAGHDMNNMQ